MALSDDLRYLIEYDILKAQRMLRSLVADLPRSYESRLLLGDTYLRGLQFELALEQYSAAKMLMPDARLPLLKIALCQIYTGQYAAALADFDQLNQRGRDEDALSLAGLMLHRLGRPAEASARYRALIEGADKCTNDVLFGLQGLMAVLRDQGRVLEADSMAVRLLEHLRRRPAEASNELYVLNSSYDYHEWSDHADKGKLAELLARHGGNIQADRFFPESFVMPQQRAALVDYAATRPPGSVYIVKPRRGQGGQSITLTDQIDAAANAEEAVVQRYIDDPYLVDGKKAHLRIYGLVTASDPMRLYVYRDGIVRFAPEPYRRVPGWLEQGAMHVTNTALHRNHPKLVINTDPNAENVGNIWSLRAYLSQIAADGHDADRVFADIARMVGRFVLMLDRDGMFERQRRMAAKRSFVPKLFGLDVLLDRTLRPWLIEIQRGPAWSGPPLVQRINNTLAETLARMNVGRLVADGMPPERVAAILADPKNVEEREREIEYENRGSFVRVVINATG